MAMRLPFQRTVRTYWMRKVFCPPKKFQSIKDSQRPQRLNVIRLTRSVATLVAFNLATLLATMGPRSVGLMKLVGVQFPEVLAPLVSHAWTQSYSPTDLRGGRIC